MQSRFEQLEQRRLLTAALMAPIDVVTSSDGSDPGTAPVQADPAPSDGADQGDPVLLADPVFIVSPAPQSVDPVVDPSFAAPTLAQNADGSVQLSWAPLAGAQSYIVERSDAGGDFYNVYANVNGTTAVDPCAQPGVHYDYRIVTDPDSAAPAASGSASIVTAGVAAPDWIGVANASDTQVDLEWTWSGAASGVTYTVQRRAVPDANGDDGPFQTIATGVTDTHFSDATITPGGNYDYRVITVAQGQESAPTWPVFAAAVGQLNVSSATIDSHVDVGQTATLQLTYDLPPGGGHPSVTIFWSDGTSSDISDPATAGDIQTSLSADGTQMTITATHQYTADETCTVSVDVGDGTKATSQYLTVIVGTGQGPVFHPDFYGTTNGGGVYLADGVVARGDVASALADGAATSSSAQSIETPVFAMGAAASSASLFNTASPAVFAAAGVQSLFDLAQTPATTSAAPEQPFGTVIIPATETRTEKTQEDNLDFLDASAPAQEAASEATAAQPATLQPTSTDQPATPGPVQVAPTPILAPAPAPAAATGQQSRAQPSSPIPASSRGEVTAPAKNAQSATLAPAGVALLLAQRFHRPAAKARKRARR